MGIKKIQNHLVKAGFLSELHAEAEDGTWDVNTAAAWRRAMMEIEPDASGVSREHLNRQPTSFNHRFELELNRIARERDAGSGETENEPVNDGGDDSNSEDSDADNDSDETDDTDNDSDDDSEESEEGEEDSEDEQSSEQGSAEKPASGGKRGRRKRGNRK